jgi:hypothetical protein
MTTTTWDLVREGWGVIWWLLVDGIPVALTEVQTGLTLPTGITSESPTLFLNGAGECGVEVRPDEGVAAGLSLSFRLLDTAAVRALLTLPSVVTRLTQDLSAAETTTMHVEDSTGLSSPVYLGHELIAFGGSTATTLTTLTRAGGGGLAYAHRAVGAGGLVASGPMPDWRGRRVRLYAAAADPSGYASGASLAAISTEVWAGYVDEGPYRDDRGAWRVDALPLVRRLAEPLPVAISGIIDATTSWVSIQPDKVTVWLAWQAAGSQVTQKFEFQTYAIGSGLQTKPASTVREDFAAAWAAAATALPATYLTAVHFGWDAKAKLFRVNCDVGASPPATDLGAVLKLNVNGKELQQLILLQADGSPVYLDWTFTTSPLHDSSIDVSGDVVVRIPSDDPADVPAPGAFVHKGSVYRYATKTVLEGAVRLGGLVPPIDASQFDGDEVQFVATAQGALVDVLRQVIESSGTSSLRGSYDVLTADGGYGVDDSQVDEASFAGAGGALSGLYLDALVSGRAWSDVFGGLLMLSERALVQRVDDGVCRLALVSVAPVGSGGVGTITDADLFTAAGESPIEVERGGRTPSVIELELASGIGDAGPRLVMQRDGSRRQQAGAVSLRATVPIGDAALALNLATVWAAARFGRLQQPDRLRLRVGAWVRGEVGDMVQLDLRHPYLFDRAAGTPGYTGAARVFSRTIDPDTLVLTLGVIPAVGLGLSPAARVEGYAGTAGAPTAIDVGFSYLAHFAAAIADKGGAIKLLHFKPGAAEGTSQGYTVSAAAESGGYCRLTVASIIGTPTLATTGDRSHLTLPVSGDAAIGDYQAGFAHTDSTGFWQ